MAASRNMKQYFGTNGLGKGGTSVPANARVFGLVIEDRELKRFIDPRGIRAHHIPFQYIENIPTKSKAASYDSVEITGRFESLMLFRSGENINCSLTLMYHAEGTDSNPNHVTPWTIEQLERLTRRLESLVYPAYDNKFGPPNTCKLNIGSLFVDFPVRIRNVSLSHRPPFKIETLQSFRQDIVLDLISAYPMNQAISAEAIERSTYLLEEASNSVFAAKRFNARSVRNK